MKTVVRRWQALLLLAGVVCLGSACQTAPSIPAVTPMRPATAHSLHTALPAAVGKPAVPVATPTNNFIAGNRITLLYDGPQTMAAMKAAIRRAQHHIHLETYIFDQDALGQEFAALLIERQRAGVQVAVIYDSVGTLGTPQEFFDNMQAAGIAMLAFNPINPSRLHGEWLPNQRDHRKILVVDGRIGFTGGVNISSTYANSSLFRAKAKRQNKVGWRDTHLQIEGPAVAALQTIFLQTWEQQQAAALPERQFFPPLPVAGNKQVQVLASMSDSDNAIYHAYLQTIESARKSIHITCAYFVPDPTMLRALLAAAKRGVQVQIILPGISDSQWMLHASQSFYTEMLASGIQIFQMQIAVLHAKTAVIDRNWATVGSTNIDSRSFLHNNEVNIVVAGSEFAEVMEAAFTEDLRYALPVTQQMWQQRMLGDRMREWLARQFAYWL